MRGREDAHSAFPTSTISFTISKDMEVTGETLLTRRRGVALIQKPLALRAAQTPFWGRQFGQAFWFAYLVSRRPTLFISTSKVPERAVLRAKKSRASRTIARKVPGIRHAQSTRCRSGVSSASDLTVALGGWDTARQLRRSGLH